MSWRTESNVTIECGTRDWVGKRRGLEARRWITLWARARLLLRQCQPSREHPQPRLPGCAYERFSWLAQLTEDQWLATALYTRAQCDFESQLVEQLLIFHLCICFTTWMGLRYIRGFWKKLGRCVCREEYFLSHGWAVTPSVCIRHSLSFPLSLQIFWLMRNEVSKLMWKCH